MYRLKTPPSLVFPPTPFHCLHLQAPSASSLSSSSFTSTYWPLHRPLSLHLTSCPSNKVTFPLPPLFSLFVNSCTKRVSQLCLSSQTEWLITWIVAFPSPSQSLSFAVFLSSASLSLPLLSQFSSCNLSVPTPAITLQRLSTAGHPSVCPHSFSQLHFTHSPLLSFSNCFIPVFPSSVLSFSFCLTMAAFSTISAHRD